MGVRSLYDAEENMTALYCSVSGLAFGPTLEGNVGNEFCEYVAEFDNRDLREIPNNELEAFAVKFAETGLPSFP